MILRLVLPQRFLTSSIAYRLAHSSGSSGVGTSGIEHADELKKFGEKYKVDWNKYKVEDYYKNNEWTYYDIECQISKYRLPQPDPRKPDTPRTTTADKAAPKK